jgi:hypothetical protein
MESPEQLHFQRGFRPALSFPALSRESSARREFGTRIAAKRRESLDHRVKPGDDKS